MSAELPLDPQVVAQPVVRRQSDPLERLTAREREVAELGLPKADADHRRVLAVLRFLGVGA